MNPCPVCNEALVPDRLAAPALDVYQGESMSYAYCEHCGILVLQDQFEPDAEVDYSESGYYQRHKAKWSAMLGRIMALFVSYRMRIVRNAVGSTDLEGKRMLDIGCGKGRFLLRARVEGAEVSGVEPTRRSYDEARASLDGAVKNAMMTRDLFPSGAFDIVTMWHVFEHIPDPVSMLEACHDVLKPGGMLIIAVPNFRGLIASWGGAVWFNLDPPRHVVHYDPGSLGHLLGAHGFEVGKIDHFYPELTYLSAMQTLLNKLPITPNFLFNYLKRNRAGLPRRSVVYAWDAFLTLIFGTFLAPVALVLVPVLSFMERSDCITLIARKVP